jgi:hypothetical protein
MNSAYHGMQAAAASGRCYSAACRAGSEQELRRGAVVVLGLRENKDRCVRMHGAWRRLRAARPPEHQVQVQQEQEDTHAACPAVHPRPQRPRPRAPEAQTSPDPWLISPVSAVPRAFLVRPAALARMQSTPAGRQAGRHAALSFGLQAASRLAAGGSAAAGRVEAKGGGRRPAFGPVACLVVFLTLSVTSH